MISFHNFFLSLLGVMQIASCAQAAAEKKSNQESSNELLDKILDNNNSPAQLPPADTSVSEVVGDDPRLMRLKNELLKLGQDQLDLDQTGAQNQGEGSSKDQQNSQQQQKNPQQSSTITPKTFQELRSTRSRNRTHPSSNIPSDSVNASQEPEVIDPRVLIQPIMRGEDPSIFIRWSQTDVEPVPMALIKDDKNFLIIFGKKGLLKEKPVENLIDGFENIEILENEKKLVIQITPRKGLSPIIEHTKNGWFFRFKADFLKPTKPIIYNLPRSPNDPFTFNLDNIKKVIPYKLPTTKQDLIVVATNIPGAGVEKSLEFPRFKLLKTGQGIAIDSLDSDLKVEDSPKEVHITHPSGLSISSENLRFQNRNKIVFKGFFAGKAGPEWRNDERRIRARINTYLHRTDKGLDLIRYYLTLGLAPEANAFLANEQQLHASIAQDLRFSFMQGLHKILNLSADEAYGIFKDLNIDPQIALWRKITKALRILDLVNPSYEDLNKHDIEKLKSFKQDLLNLPPPIQDLIIPLLSNSIADIKDKDNARYFLDLVPRPRIRLRAASYDLAHAKVLLLEDKLEEGMAILKNLAGLRTNLKIAVEASYEVVKYQYKNKEINLKQAILHLERLRFLWREDLLEYRIVHKLATLYELEGKLLQSMRLLKRLWERFPQHSQRDHLSDQIKDQFILAILDPQTQLNAYKRVSLYEEFLQFTPDTVQGDEAILKIADDLVSLDLLDKASQLLIRYIESLRRDNVAQEKNSISSMIDNLVLKVAEIQINNNQPEEARATLERIVSGQTDDQSVLRATQLRAYMHVKQGQYQMVLNEVFHLQDMTSLQLKAQALMGLKDWNQASNTYRSIVNNFDDTMPLDLRASLVTDYALATALSGDPHELYDIKERFENLVKETSFKDKFNFIVNLAPSDDPDSSRDYQLSQFSQVDNLSSLRNFLFMKK